MVSKRVKNLPLPVLYSDFPDSKLCHVFGKMPVSNRKIRSSKELISDNNFLILPLIFDFNPSIQSH